LSYSNQLEPVQTRVGPQEARYRIEQSIPFPWKLRKKGLVALENARAEYEKFRSQHLRLRADVKSAFYEFAYLAKALAINEENLNLLVNLERVAQTKFKSGGASNQDLLKAQVELGRLANEVETLKDMIPVVAGRLNALLNRDWDAVLPLPERIPQTQFAADTESLANGWRRDNPLLKSVQHNAAEAELGVGLAKLDYVPDLSVGYERILTGESMTGVSGSGEDAEMVMVSINLPLWLHSRRARVREAEAELNASRESAEAFLRDLDSRGTMAAYQYRNARRQAGLYEHALLPKANQALKAAQTDYSGGRTDFLTLVDSQRTLLEFHLAYYRAVASAEQYLAELEVLAGRSLGEAIP
ncbi:MAG: TolC family protein, partial [Candidatus Omnitrophica bacterium]|nr:TolC family protein [Candidatus Omnitrophota bacterium]